MNTFGGGSYPGSSQSDFFWFTAGRWSVTNRTEENYKRQFTVLLSVYKHTV